MKILDKFLDHLDSTLDGKKGGKGSGNWGHKGRPGIRGGSARRVGSSLSYSYNGINYKGKPTLGEFITLYRWEKAKIDTKGVPVVLNEKDLPKVEPGYQRLAHGTSLKNVQSISSTGLKTGKEAQSGEQIGAILTVKGSSSSFGDASFVFDLKTNDKWRSVNKEWVEVYRTVKPLEMKGIVLGKGSAGFEELGTIIPAYRKRYGEVIFGSDK